MDYLNPNPQVEVSQVTVELKKLFLEKGLTWGSPVFLREYKYRNFAAVGIEAARKQKILEENAKCSYVDPKTGWNMRTRCPYIDSYEYLKVEADDPIHGVIEAWVKQGDGYVLFRTYNVCAFSGLIGPKKKASDMQTPEGIFTATTRATCSYYLGLDVSYPSTFDIKTNPATGNRGGSILIHGACMSDGCSAVSGQIPEIYALAKSNGGSVPFHVFPFPLTTENINAATSGGFSQWRDFWLTLKPVHDAFEETRNVPKPSVVSVSPADKANGITSYNGWQFSLTQAVAARPRVFN